MRLLIAILLTATSTAFARPSFCLPERIYAAPGLELNVYFSDIFDSIVPQNYAYQAYCPKGCAELTRWCFTPTAQDAGREYRLVINAWNDEGMVSSVTSTVVVAKAPTNPTRKVTLALFGDSLTNCRFQDQILLDMKEAGFTGYTPVGSRASSNGTALHDGYGGYTFRTFLENYKISEEEMANIQDAAEREQLKALGVPVKIIRDWQRHLLRSPLVKFENGVKSVDVRRWLNKVNGGIAPDIVLIELGVNSVFKYRGEPNELRKQIREQVIADLELFLKTLRMEMPNTTYLLCTQPVGTSQNGFGANYGASWNEIQFRKIIFTLNREYMQFVKEKNDPKLILLPLGHAVDPIEGYVQATHKLSARSLIKAKKNVNAVHLSDVGGYQMGDTIAAMLMNLLANE